MPPIIRTKKEEDDFMSNLWNAADEFEARIAPTTPTRQRHPPVINSPSTRQFHHVVDSVSASIQRTPGKIFAADDCDLDELIAGAEEWDWDDMNSDIFSPKRTKSPKKAPPASRIAPPPPAYIHPTCTRCVVKAVDIKSSSAYLQKTLTVQVIPSNELRRVILQDEWIDADVHTGDIVNILGIFTTPPSSSSQPAPSSTITISSKENTLIHHPDLLITATALSTAPQCSRKPLVTTLVRSPADVSPALVWGNVLHEVMQACLCEGRWDMAWIEQETERVVRQQIGELMRVGVDVKQAVAEVRTRAQGLRLFAEKYISAEPKSDAVLTNTRAVQGQTSLLAIAKLYDVEEDIWSPTYGLKGKVDASVQAVITECSAPGTHSQIQTQTWTLPFEIKTGRAVAGMEHRAQTMLYTLLMAERYGTEVPSGLLYYTRSDEVVRVPKVRNEMRALLVARNEMAGWMMRKMRVAAVGERQVKLEGARGDGEAGGHGVLDVEEPFLPPTIDNAWQCGKCFVLDTCMLYRRAAENVEDTTSPIADIYALTTSHITPQQGAFFKKWEALISLEEQDLVRFKKELWTMGAQERESHGRCFSNMALDPSYQRRAAEDPRPFGSKIHGYTYRFTKEHQAQTSLLNGHMSCGDAITVSVEPSLLAFTKGFIVDLTPHEVVVGVDHEVDLGAIRTRTRRNLFSDVIFRIDKDELFSGMGRIRDNLAQLFYADGDAKRLRLVVDLKRPDFSEDENLLEDKPRAILRRLNARQQLAVGTVLRAQDYALILGMPGTGKTTIIAVIIQILVCLGKSVLLASYTHSAVDAILLKLKHTADFAILRLGNPDKIHPDVHEFTLADRRVPTTLEQLEQQVLTPPVVATTCLSIDHPVFSRRTFDYCIVDEASQITLPTCLGPLRFADKFVLVGDHFQLPPLVRNRTARKGGLDVSLFRMLSDAHPHAVVDLNEQYRMNAEIMLLSNKLIYGDRLQCGSEDVAKRSLQIPNSAVLWGLHSRQSSCAHPNSVCWLGRLLDERSKAIFVDTDAVPARDSPVGDLVENRVEASLIHQVTECLIRSGVPQNQIGILTLYRQQIKLLSHSLQGRHKVEILTADRSQGRDKECIIISMVRSNDDGQVGDLMQDWRRMNVAFTRARSKLIIFGSRSTLKGTPLLKEFLELMDGKGWILPLPADAHEMHIFPGLTDSCRNKRGADDIKEPFAPDQKANTPSRPSKRGRKSNVIDEGILRGRLLLKDLINAAQ